nr:hypothetical protein [Tanacetum cinerariifolium]
MLADDTGNVVVVWAQRRSHRADTSSIFAGLVLAPMQMTPDLVRLTTNNFSGIRGLACASLKNIAGHVLPPKVLEETTPHHILHRNAQTTIRVQEQEKLERMDQEMAARVDLINSQKADEDKTILEMSTQGMDPVDATTKMLA